ncbi:MAG: ATP-grasp domain-containing protein [Pirellulaceae bacterium]|nr:ATP-grasp domain-containing protein [Pirellulaceae bacterium]
MTTNSPQLLILGVSARAAACSALRGGYAPLAADCFRDEDLAAACHCLRIDRYPGDLEHVASAFPACPWLYTGGLENHPQLVDRIAERRTLLGNSGRVLRQVRNPFRLAEALRDAGLPSLEVFDVPPGDGRGLWLRKPRKSGGGQRIEFVAHLPPKLAETNREAEPSSDVSAGPPGAFYYQQFASGTACSAIFVAAQGKALWYGATWQLIGTPWTGARRFEYAGSLGPLDVTAHERTEWEAIGDCLVRSFALSGLFGVDAVMTEEGICVVEVNPRYTASVEVIELAYETALLPLHVRACQSGELPPAGPVSPHRRVGKAIIYAQQTGRVPVGFDALVRRLNADPLRPTVADIPAVGTEFSAGDPLVTVLAHAETLDAAECSLRANVAVVQAAVNHI